MLEEDIPDIHVAKYIKRIFIIRNCIIWIGTSIFQNWRRTKYLTLLGYVYSGCIHGIIAKIIRYTAKQLQAGGYEESNKKINKIIIIPLLICDYS